MPEQETAAKPSGARRLVVIVGALAVLALAFGVVWMQSSKYEPLVVGMNAPDFTLPDRNGKPVKLSQFRGKKVLLLTWASW